MNPASSADYMKAVDSGDCIAERYFGYSAEDLRIFYLTRRLAALEVDLNEYQHLIQSQMLDDFSAEVTALRTERLMESDGQAVRPTPRGMFFADSIAALFAWRQLVALRQHQQASKPARRLLNDSETVNENRYSHM